MKVLAFTDHHGSKRAELKILALAKEEKPDLLICNGDISFFGTDVESVLKRLNTLAKRANTKMILVPGNHEDHCPMQKMVRDNQLKHLIYLHKNHYRIKDCFFMAWGSGGFAYHDPLFLKWAKITLRLAKKTEKKILLFHGPPYGTKLDLVVSGHCGNKDYTSFVKNNNVDLVLCGHIHECFGQSQKLGKAIALNPGPFGAIIEMK